MTETAKVEITDYWEETTGDYYFSRPEVIIHVSFDDVEVPAGKSWVGFEPDSVGDDIAYLLTADGFGCEIMGDLQYWGYPRWSSASYLWGTAYDLAWTLEGYSSGPPGVSVWIQAGTESIDGVAANLGTFPELDLTATCEIWEFITDPENGTQQYTDEITNIDLETPLGGTLPLPFDDFTFAYEGRYGLYMSMPNEGDDFEKNNNLRVGIGVDGTDPVSSHALDPATPDGENGWYVSDCEVTLDAYDVWSEDVNSGVDKIMYKVDGGATQEIDGNHGSFLITQADDAENVEVEYWAVDKVGNAEDSHTFNIDMDQTDPTIDLSYECLEGGNPIQGWTMEFTAEATDITSGMDRVEFYLNEGLQSIVTGSGPTYVWEFQYWGDLSIDITAIGYDIAGNFAQDIVEDPKSTDYNYNQNSQQQTIQTLQG
jgi:hypothetical protein